MPAHLIRTPFQFIDSNGNPVSGGTVEFYEPNGSSTPKAVYSDKTLTTSAGTSATLNALGMFSTELFGSGDYYMVVKYADASTAYDMEYIEGEGSGNNAATEWVESVTPTYIGATSFSVPGDLTSDFHVNRRIKTENTGGTVYSTIVSSAYTSLTTVTVVNDSGTLDSGLSSVELGFLRADNISFPEWAVSSEVSSGPSATISTGSITVPANKDLRLTANLIYHASNVADTLGLIINGDTTGTNYYTRRVRNVTDSGSLNGRGIAYPVSTDDKVSIDLTISPNSTSGQTLITGSINVFDDTTNTQYVENIVCTYMSSAAITSIAIDDSTTNSVFDNGSRIRLSFI